VNAQDNTEMGGSREAFLTTHWSLIEGIQSNPDPDTTQIGTLLEAYWKPVYCFLRRKGCDNEKAKDTTQDFFHEVVLNRRLIERADPDKGRFRSILLHALKQYLINRERDAQAQKRIPRGRLISMDTMDLATIPQEMIQSSAEDIFHYAWLTSLMERVVVMVRENCLKQDLGVHWNLFNERVLQPLLAGTTAPELAGLCRKYGVEDIKKGSNMMMTAKRRFRSTLIEQIRNTVASEALAAEEMEELMHFVQKNAQPL
jgi:hypothetical protein